jgi:hypothetical protein
MTKISVLTTLALSVLAAPAWAGPQTQLVTNGDFAITTNQTNSSCQLSYNCTATGWSSPNGYNFIYVPNTATSTGAAGQYNAVSLWGAANGGASSWDGNVPAAIAGSNFLAADGAFETVAIQQTITGLTIGSNYTVSFDWAGAQQSGYTSATSDEWLVSLGNETKSTGVVQLVPEGFTGWMTEDMTFQATSTSEILSFLAVGTPNGEPPFSLLTDVSMLAVPEPGSFAMVGAGVLGMLALRRKRAA